MKKVIISTFLLGIFALLIACGGESDGNPNFPAKESEEPEATASNVDGKEVYTKNCVVCHGVYGDMGASGAFNLAESTLSVDEKVNVITNGRNTMLAFKNVLSEDEIKAVADYTETLKK